MYDRAQEGMGGCRRLWEGMGGHKIVWWVQLNIGRGKNEVVSQRCQSPMLHCLPNVQQGAKGHGRVQKVVGGHRRAQNGAAGAVERWRGKNEVVGQRCQNPMLRGLPNVRQGAGRCGRVQKVVGQCGRA